MLKHKYLITMISSVILNQFTYYLLQFLQGHVNQVGVASDAFSKIFSKVPTNFAIVETFIEICILHLD